MSVRLAALGVVARVHQGLGTGAAALVAEAAGLVPWLEAAPASMSLSIRGEPMPITVDSVNAVAVLSFADDRGDAVAPPAGAQATATSDNPAVLAVGAGAPGVDASGVATIEFPLSAVSAGTATLSATATDGAGGPLIGPDGVTPIPDPPPVPVTVNPGAAAAERFVVPGG